VGIPSSFRLALRFPYDPVGVARHPTQLYYSFAAAAILLLLVAVEHRIVRREYECKKPPRYSLLAPLGLILFSVMRLSIGLVRARNGLSLSHWILIAAMPFEAIWLTVSWRSLRHKEI
jgi:prolipoprotein diacylglyceryltransferase